MGLPIIKSIVHNVIGTFIGNLLFKILMWVIIIVMTHGLFIYLLGDMSYGTALGKAFKQDYNFVINNSDTIITKTKSNLEDFKKEVK